MDTTEYNDKYINFDDVSNEMKPRLREYVEMITSHKGGRNQYVCPLCDSGAKRNGTPAFSLNSKTNYTTWKCFSCGKKGDVFDLIGLYEGIDKPYDCFKRAMELFNYQGNITTDAPVRKTYKAPEKAPEVDYTDFFLEANKDVCKTDYHRGLHKDTLDLYKVGYVEKWRHPSYTYGDYSSRLIIPVTKYSYVARNTNDNDKTTPKVMKVGHANTFNKGILVKCKEPIFIVEGEIDALSIIDVGFNCIGLGSMNYIDIFIKNVEKAIDKLEKQGKDIAPFIIIPDNDKDEKTRAKVRAATDNLKKELDRLGCIYSEVDILGDCKDCNEYLMKDALKFGLSLDEVYKEIKEKLKIYNNYKLKGR